ncbi:MAG: histidinol-phosphate transaminase [Woeseiaceae bacterium]|nr:histidinol-phosphate transaminase [Woeseiaceae bacterium]NIP20337.1 histidinol-phosphate transaminase [Woeseiaceae bacterium]NIS89227.1 histidinol-phosphate transaminase [Woeseiaceae bacterium]
MSITRLARAAIRDLRPYEAAIQVDDTIRLNANEAPWRNSADHFHRPLNRYPEIRPARLRALLAERYGCAPENLLVTRGTSEAIDLLMRVFCTAGVDNIVTTFPTFSMYEHYAVVQGAELRQVETDGDNDFLVAAESVLTACDDGTKIVFLCSPNNPTGTLVPRDTLLRILEDRKDRSIVVVDEAYIEFSGAGSATDLIPSFENLVVLRTLSKALAFAGARCGSVIGNKRIVDILDAVQAPYALATPVVECVENALANESLADAEHCVAETINERARLRAELEKFSFVSRVWPSAANFLLVEVVDPAALMLHCAKDGLLLRHFAGQLANCVRITVGTPEENARLVESLGRLEDKDG